MRLDRAGIVGIVLLAIIATAPACRCRDEPAQAPPPAPVDPAPDYQEAAAITAIRLLSQVSPDTFANQTIQLDAVPVASRVGRGVWIGFRPSSLLLVVPVDPAALAGLEPGDRVAIRGTVRVLPPEPEAMARFAIDAESAHRAAESGVYLEALMITETAPPPSE